MPCKLKISFRRSKSFKKYDENSFTLFSKEFIWISTVWICSKHLLTWIWSPETEQSPVKVQADHFFIKPDDLKSHPLILQTTYNVEQYDIESDEWYEIQDMGIFRSALGCTIIKNVKLDILRKFCAPRDPLPLQHHTNKSE